MLSSQLSYRTNAIHYKFECQWVTPKYIPSDEVLLDLSGTNWETETHSGTVQVQPVSYIGGKSSLLQMLLLCSLCLIMGITL